MQSMFIVIGVFLFLLGIMAVLIILIIKESNSKRKVLQDAARELEKAAYVDSLTGLPNLTKFRIDVEAALENAKPGEYMLATVDIDNFKYINDIYGFETGNKILMVMSEEMQKDAKGGAIISRVVADNFAFFFRKKPIEELLANQANHDKIMKRMKQLLGENYQIKFSVGAYEINDIKKDILLMIDYANIAKKSQKGYYRNSIAEYTYKMDEKLKDLQEITVSMEKALAEEEFVPFVQPKYSLITGKIAGAEILVRWVYPGKGIIPPDMFIPLFEKNGFIERLDMYMFEKTCKMIAELKQKGVEDIPRISVNMSKYTVVKKDLIETIVGFTEKYSITPKELEVELTESALGEDSVKILRIMAELKEKGFFVSIDDFGSGYSSLNLLKDITADVLKIDKGFLSDTLNTRKGCDIIHSVINMSKCLDLETVAEGVETLGQAEQLKEMGCDIAQGFYFSRPIPSKEFEELLLQ